MFFRCMITALRHFWVKIFNRLYEDREDLCNKLFLKHSGQYTYLFNEQLGSGLSPESCLYFQSVWGWKFLKGTLMQIWKSVNIFVFIWKQYVEDFTLTQLLHFEICTRDICDKAVYKHSETIEYVENELSFQEIYKLHG